MLMEELLLHQVGHQVLKTLLDLMLLMVVLQEHTQLTQPQTMRQLL